MKAKRNPTVRSERGIVQALIRHLKKSGFEIRAFNDGDESIKMSGEKAALDGVFSVDESWLYFGKSGFKSHYVYLVGGNGEDIISDWSFADGDPDGFDKAMDAFLSMMSNPRKKNPDIHIDIHSHNTKGRNVRAKNPASDLFSTEHIARLQRAYAKIHHVNPGSESYRELIAQLDRLTQPQLKQIAGAEILFLSKLARNRVRKENPAGNFVKGERVQLHAATDDWMRGDRYGEVIGYGKKAKYRDRQTGEIFEVRPVRVKLDKSGKTKRYHPDNLHHL